MKTNDNYLFEVCTILYLLPIKYFGGLLGLKLFINSMILNKFEIFILKLYFVFLFRNLLTEIIY